MRCDATIAFSFTLLFLTATGAMLLSAGRAGLQTQVQANVVEKSRAKRGVHGRGLFCAWPHRQSWPNERW